MMILFTILTIMLLVVAAVAVLAIGIGGGAFVVVFGDLIVCVVFIALIIRCLIRRKRKK